MHPFNEVVIRTTSGAFGVGRIKDGGFEGLPFISLVSGELPEETARVAREAELAKGFGTFLESNNSAIIDKRYTCSKYHTNQ